MRDSKPGWFQKQARFLRHQFQQGGELPFTNVLSEEVLTQHGDRSHTIGS